MVKNYRIEKIRSQAPNLVMQEYGEGSTTIMRGVKKSSKLQ